VGIFPLNQCYFFRVIFLYLNILIIIGRAKNHGAFFMKPFLTPCNIGSNVLPGRLFSCIVSLYSSLKQRTNCNMRMKRARFIALSDTQSLFRGDGSFFLYTLFIHARTQFVAISDRKNYLSHSLTESFSLSTTRSFTEGSSNHNISHLIFCISAGAG